jgi:hypothetical protein
MFPLTQIHLVPMLLRGNALRGRARVPREGRKTVLKWFTTRVHRNQESDLELALTFCYALGRHDLDRMVI